MIKWVKPSGAKVETNELEANVKAAESLGWKRADEAPKKRGRPAKSEKAK